MSKQTSAPQALSLEELHAACAQAFGALLAVAGEVTPGVRPQSSSSYLPPGIVEAVQQAVICAAAALRVEVTA